MAVSETERMVKVDSAEVDATGAMDRSGAGMHLRLVWVRETAERLQRSSAKKNSCVPISFIYPATPYLGGGYQPNPSPYTPIPSSWFPFITPLQQ